MAKIDVRAAAVRDRLRTLLASDSGVEVFNLVGRTYLDLPCQLLDYDSVNRWAAGVGGRCETDVEIRIRWVNRNWYSIENNRHAAEPFSRFVSLPWLTFIDPRVARQYARFWARNLSRSSSSLFAWQLIGYEKGLIEEDRGYSRAARCVVQP